MVGALAAGALGCAPAPPAAAAQPGVGEPTIIRLADTRVTIAVLPYGTEPEQLEPVEGLAPGVMSAGLSNVSPVQTYLDIGQGNRVFTSLYHGEPPLLPRFQRRVPDWSRIEARAESAPAEIVPGLLASALRGAGVPVQADSLLALPSLMLADRGGRIERTPPLRCLRSSCRGVTALPATLEQLAGLIARQRADDLLIAIERAPPPERDTLTIGLAGRGFSGNLTSDTTRTNGFVLATDIAPTILARYGIEVPEEMSGRPIRSEGDRDAVGVAERASRMRVVAGRRASVILDNLMIWAALALAAALLTRGRASAPAFALLGLATVYLPLLLLVGAAADTNELAERLIVGVGAPVLAVATLALRRGWEALAIACGITVGAYTVDVIVGSPLTAKSLLGPNPGLGVRFFGIGNELEAALAILTMAGTGAALTAVASSRGGVNRRAAAGAFLGAGLVAAMIFAVGRFGADVGAAIVFPAAAALAALALPGAGRRGLVVGVAALPLLALAALAAIDLALGGNAHLSRSVFEAGGADQVADVAERRLRLSASSFRRALDQPLFWFALSAIVAAIVFRHRLSQWLARAPLARAGLIGATGGTLVGVVANDSGALFVIIGSITLLACLAFAYGQQAGLTARGHAPHGGTLP